MTAPPAPPRVREFLCACVRSSVRGEPAPPVPRDMDWPALMAEALRDKCLLLVADALAGAAVPQDVTHELRRHRKVAELNARFLRRELVRVCTELETAGIPVLCLKGPVLDVLAHGGRGRRMYGDLDILVHRDDFAAARQRLAQDAYRPMYPGEVEQEIGQSQMMRADRRVSIDLHFRLAPRDFVFRLDPPALWEGARGVVLPEGEVRTASASMSIALVCLQGAKERWGELIRVADLAGLVSADRPDAVDWEDLLAMAQAAGSTRVLALGLALAERLMGIPVPAPVAPLAGSRELQRVAARIADTLCGRRVADDSWLADKHRLHWFLRESVTARIAYARRCIPYYGRLLAARLRR